MRIVLTFFFSILYICAFADPIKDIKGLQSVTFIELTSGIYEHTFSLHSNELNNRFTGSLNYTDSDFHGWVGHEFYDVFYSDEDGKFNTEGNCISVEVTFNSNTSSGLNIAEVLFNYDDGVSLHATSITSVLGLSPTYNPESVFLANDCDKNTGSSMGQTNSNSNQKLRLTFAFNPPRTEIIEIFCSGSGDYIELNGEIYDETKPYGIEFIDSETACDSVLIIDLYYKDCSLEGLENCHFFLPNVFTPNADGINDYFSLIHEDPCIHYSLNIEIYDRWGNCVYQAFKIDFEWDGKHHDLPLSTGVYVWHLSYRKKAQGILFHEFGDLTIIR